MKKFIRGGEIRSFAEIEIEAKTKEEAIEKFKKYNINDFEECEIESALKENTIVIN